MTSIPFDVGLKIASSVNFHRDVAVLCLVSSQWLEAARPILYKHLKVKYGSITLQDTLRLLDKDEWLRSRVTVLHLDGSDKEPTEESATNWVNSLCPSLEGMKNIQVVRMSRFYEFHASQVQDLLQNIYTTVPGLERIEWNDIEYSKSCKDSYLGPLQATHNRLKDVRVNHSVVPTNLLNSFFPDPELITKLVLYCSVYNPKHRLYFLEQIRLPNLEDFNISGYTRQKEDVARPLLTFLAGHPSIKTCSISSNRGFYVEPSSPRNILPNLTSLSANLAMADDLSQLSFSFKNLIALEVGGPMLFEETSDGNEGVIIHYPSTFAQIVQRIGGFHQLRYFKPCVLHDYKTLRLLETMSPVAPLLEHLAFYYIYPGSATGELPFLDHTMSTFIRVLNSFPMLQRIDFRGKIIIQSQALQYARQSKTIRLINLFFSNRAKPDVVIEREGDEANPSAEFRIVERPYSTPGIWWMEE